MPKGKVIVIQGGQYGSESKGLITAKVVNERKAQWCVRTGTVNAGHTVYYGGVPYKMQQLPVGWVRPECKLVLGAGAYIHPEVLNRELIMVAKATGVGVEDVLARLYIDSNCGLHLPIHTHRSTESGRHHAMGATGKGCSEAVVDKIQGRGRPREHHLFRTWADTNRTLANRHAFFDTALLLNEAYDRGEIVVIEGTQGTFLDLHLGPYPYTTHKQTQAASWLAECGLAPTLNIETILVMRTYPIRVAGNSGPLPNEVSWANVARRMADRGFGVSPASVIRFEDAVMSILVGAGAPTRDPAYWSEAEKLKWQDMASEAHALAWANLPSWDQAELSRLFERTTVTNKLRRIAEWDAETAKRSVMLNRPASIALTFMNYVFPKAWKVDRIGFGNLPREYREQINTFLCYRHRELGVPLRYVSYGPEEQHTFSMYEDEYGVQS